MSKLSIGIVGLPNVGKSTLFNALTKNEVPAENYPFCTIDPSVGIVPVPDERLDKLFEFSKSTKKLPAVVEFVDIAGLVAGASKGEGLGNKFLSHIREVDAILHMVRTFKDSDITHVADKVDPLSDIEVINMELILADLETVQKRMKNLEKEVRRSIKEAVTENTILKKVEEALLANTLANTLDLSIDEGKIVKQLNLITMKPVLYGLNISEASENLAEEVASKIPGKHVKLDPIFEVGLDELITASYELLGLQTFFTTGEAETRAWTTKIGATAPEAGMAIHTDFKDKFIRAEVIGWEELLSTGSKAKAREAGLLRTEGKTYIVKDGDVVEFKI